MNIPTQVHCDFHFSWVDVQEGNSWGAWKLHINISATAKKLFQNDYIIFIPNNK